MVLGKEKICCMKSKIYFYLIDFCLFVCENTIFIFVKTCHVITQLNTRFNNQFQSISCVNIQIIQ